MPPRNGCRASPATPASDLWGLGVLLYEMLTGGLPFAADTRVSLLRRIAGEAPAPLPPAHARVERVVRRALEKDPPRRHPTARALVQDYADAVGIPTCWSFEPTPLPPAAAPAPPPAVRRRQPRTAAAMAGAAALLIGGLAVPALLRHPPGAANREGTRPPRPLAPVQVRIAAARQERRSTSTPEALLSPVPLPGGDTTPDPPLRLLKPLGLVKPPRIVQESLVVPVPAAPPPATRAAAYTVTALGPLGDDIQGLNDRSQSVGGLNGFAVLWEDGALRRLDPPPVHTALTPYSEAAAINDQGQVVGFSHRHAFLWQAGRMTDLGTPAGSPSNATALNDQGQVVGTSHGHAVLWQDGQVTDLGTLGGEESHARAINDRGQVAGVSYTAKRYYHAFLWDDGTMQDLGTLGGPSSLATAINDRGQVAGLSITASGATHAFLWQDGHMQDLGALAGASQACGIGPRGEVVGASAGHAVLWRNGKIVDLNRRAGPGFAGTLHRALAVNASGQILCYGQRRGSPLPQAFLLTPASSLLPTSGKVGG